MPYFRRTTPGRRFLLASAVVGIAVLAGSAIAYAAYPTDTVTVMTGCLASNGTLKNVATSATTPTAACGTMKLVHISGGTITRVSAGVGVTLSGSGGSGYVNNGFATVGIDPKYRLPQSSCAKGQFVTPNGSGGWACQTPTAVPKIFSGGVNDNGSSASFFLGGSGMTVSEVSTGVTKITVTSAATQPILTVTAVGADATQHCVIGNSVSTNAYEIDCYDQGMPWPTFYHVMAIVP